MVAANANAHDNTRLHRLDGEMAELCLLVPAWQAEALEQAAQCEGITVAQFLRRVLNRPIAQITVGEAGYYLG